MCSPGLRSRGGPALLLLAAPLLLLALPLLPLRRGPLCSGYVASRRGGHCLGVARQRSGRGRPAAAQAERRRQGIGLRQVGMTYAAIAGQVGLSRTGGINICQRCAAEGAKGVVSQPRGRKPEEQRLLEAAQEAEVRGLIRPSPDALGLPFALCSRAAVGGDAGRPPRRCRAGRAHAGQVPGALAGTAQKPIWRAYDQGPGRDLLGRRDRLALG